MHPHHAVMIIDVQQAFDPPAAFVRKVETYSRRFPCRIFTRFINPAGSMFREVLKQNSCAPASDDTNLLIKPNSQDIVLNKIARYGLSPHHLQRLRERRITRVTVCGLDTDACVLGVLFSLFDAGIRCHLKETMCWSSSGLHQPALKIIRSQFRETR